MLLISRYIGYDQYGVVDTDDGVEDVLTRKDIVKLLREHRLDIKGVTTHRIVNSCGSSHIVDVVRAYQDTATMSALQLKLKTIRHVDVLAYKNIVTNIRWLERDISEPVVIRLSDFGSDTGDRIFHGNTVSRVHKITLILDENVKLHEYTFRLGGFGQRKVIGKGGIGVVLDVRELYDNGVAKMVYSSLLTGQNDNSVFDSVIDDTARKEQMKRDFQLIL